MIHLLCGVHRSAQTECGGRGEGSHGESVHLLSPVRLNGYRRARSCAALSVPQAVGLAMPPINQWIAVRRWYFRVTVHRPLVVSTHSSPDAGLSKRTRPAGTS